MLSDRSVSYSPGQVLWALGSLCALHQKPFAAELVAPELPSDSPEGIEPWVIIQAGERLGFKVRPAQITPERVSRLPLPLLVEIKDGDGFVAADSQQRVVGSLMATLERHIFSQQLVASVMMFLVLPEARMGGHAVRLLRALEQWCKNRKVVEINLGINSLTEMDSVGQFVRKMRYAKVGENFVKTAGLMA